MNKKLKGFTVIEVIISLTFFTIISSSIYLMSSYLINSSRIISNEYLSELSYRSYLERLKKNDQITNVFDDKINSFSGKLQFTINKQKTPNNKIFIIKLNTKSENKNKVFESYWRPK